MLDRMIGHNLMQCAATAIVALAALPAFQRGSVAAEQDMSVIGRASSGPLSCEIRKAAAGDAVQLTGVVSSSVASTGQVRFLLTKSGKSGNSNINQSNAFELAAGAESHVSHVTINLQREDHAMIEFVATAKDGATCRATANLEL